MTKSVKIYVLTWIFGGKVHEIKRSPSVQVIQTERTKLKKQPQYKSGRFEVRTSEGLKAKPILKDR